MPRKRHWMALGWTTMKLPCRTLENAIDIMVENGVKYSPASTPALANSVFCRVGP
jgi:hypothetical protein